MNILYLTNHLNTGGITSYVFTLAAGLKKRGHNVYVASSGGELVEKFTAEGIIYLPIPIKTKSEISYKILISRFRLLKTIRERDIDILHANTRVTQVLSFLIQRTQGKPYISTCHGFFKKRLFRKIFPCWGDRVIAISASVKEHLMQDFAVKEEKIRVIHNGIDVKKFQIPDSKSLPNRQADQIEIKKKFGLSDAPVIGIVARLSQEKGHSYLIKAMPEVIAKIPRAQLLIVGEGRQKAKLLNLVRAIGLENNVLFFPSVMDTQEVLSSLDLFVLPSLKEGLGLALMEAMALGLGVIGSDVGGIKSLIQDNYNGLLAKPADSQGLSRAILELLENPKKAEFLGNNARVFIAQNFSQEKMVLETEGVYSECLNVIG
ncbi:MAG: glycosyltransferase family 4 protein [Candidatus Omnitrophota bacterium]